MNDAITPKEQDVQYGKDRALYFKKMAQELLDSRVEFMNSVQRPMVIFQKCPACGFEFMANSKKIDEN